MAKAILKGEAGKSVDGEWETEPVDFHIHHEAGFVSVATADGLSAPTIMEAKLSDILWALAEVTE
jgi:hypothetical protein